MKLESLEPVFVETIPDTIEPGKIYISEKYGGATWLCPCGCGDNAHIPFNKWNEAWTMTKNGDLVTFTPSIQMRYGCQSHYFIRDNKIIWA